MRFSKKIFRQSLAFMLLSAMAGYCMAELKVTDAWVKLAPPSASVNAAYMQLTNDQQHLQTITRISADCCAMTMLHQTRHDQDRVFMDHLARLPIPAQSTAELKPGGLHIMLMKAHTPLLVNDPVVITLGFDDGSEQQIHLVVKADEL